MLKSMQDMMKGIGTLHPIWRAWASLLFVANMVVPLFFFGQTEARWVFAAVMFGALTGSLLVKRLGYTKLLGLMHFQWFILVPYLWGRLGDIPPDNPFGIWLRAVIALNCISLVIDVIDVGRYVRGDRKSAI